ncbi:MAG: PD-(D/E)XK nuclease family protein, partial [Akkermansiaceae bacterium]|nr:PD-(D/E)XK nuclease family protein [Akkermansiaceae bacterium]
GLLAGWFGTKIPLAVQIQAEAMRRRLAWFARVQACQRAEGWMVAGVERAIACELGGLHLTGKVDRIDRHEDGRWRVLDYKTGSINSVEGEHRTRVISSTRLPEHMADDDRLLAVVVDGKGKETTMWWRNLQLPLYLSGLRRMGVELGNEPEAGYFLIGSTEASVEVCCWEGFSGEDLASAERCGEAVVERVQAGVFWPPADRTAHGDYDELAMGRLLRKTVAQPEDWRP